MEPTRLAERVRALPGMDRLLPAVAGLPAPVYLVGGAVRDLMRGEQPLDVDLAVEGADAAAVARLLAERLGGTVTEQHERFGAAQFRAGPWPYTLTRTRRERYPAPGELPVVAPATLGEDLGRRDFTVNAMALHLRGDSLGRLEDPHNGRADLGAGLLRVLHEGSFLDDPTRLLRGLRYCARLAAELEEGTARLALEAIDAGAPTTVSGTRTGHELMYMLGETDAPAAVRLMGALGLDHALHERLTADAELVASAELGCYETGGDRVLAGLAALCIRSPLELATWLDTLGLTAPQRRTVVWAAECGPRLPANLRAVRSPSELHDLLDAEPPESMALALATGAPSEPIVRYLRELRPVRLEISGADLLAAGVPESPAVGRALAETLRRKLDGELSGRDAELAAALELAGGGEAA
jgi:tRNA nucleotidyltransferase (CCA-adding enzyme)